MLLIIVRSVRGSSSDPCEARRGDRNRKGFGRSTAAAPGLALAVKTRSDSLKKPALPPPAEDLVGVAEDVEEGSGGKGEYEKEEEEEEDEEEDGEEGEWDWKDWEDRILEDTVPLVGFSRMILHSGKYDIGVRLSPEHESAIVERVLKYHPAYEEKVGCGIDHIMIDYHPDYPTSRCMFVVHKDGTAIDFSYWKCIKGLIRKKYPLFAKTFIAKHFKRRRRVRLR
ncbi:hypothetical protein Tsubulata_001748 [Turnera subulata]|uniref:Uncharacterized protein n=1 Tax=Turnera subulata TaxID=218843 RepID=A0A9Q0G1R3_9ROSI|nr:hypothetical protein Tsubulata_001748 [Turnera subulata]